MKIKPEVVNLVEIENEDLVTLICKVVSMGVKPEVVKPEEPEVVKPEVVNLVEVENEGFVALIGENVEILCGVYIYSGKLEGVNDSFIKLSNPHLVYETGAFKDLKYKNAEHMGRDSHYVMIRAVESFGKTTKL